MTKRDSKTEFIIKRKSIALITLLILILFCGMQRYDYSSVVNKDYESVVNTYILLWETDEFNEKDFDDTLKVYLHLAALDTFHYPSWYSPPTRLHFNLLERNPVSFKFAFVDDNFIKTTNSVKDTLDQGNYFLTLDYTNLKSGIYLFHRQIGNSITTRKFMLLLN